MPIVFDGTNSLAYMTKPGDSTKRPLIADAFVPSGGTGDNKVCGYVNWNDNASIKYNSNTDYTVSNHGQVSFTIPSTPGVSTWRVIAVGSVTYWAAGYRVWGAMTLDYNADGAVSGNIGPNVTNELNSSGWSEHQWYESDVGTANSIGTMAFSSPTTATWDGVAAGSHTIRLYQYNLSDGMYSWRRGIVVHWYPSS